MSILACGSLRVRLLEAGEVRSDFGLLLKKKKSPFDVSLGLLQDFLDIL
jgi:hypothetical protein